MENNSLNEYLIFTRNQMEFEIKGKGKRENFKGGEQHWVATPLGNIIYLFGFCVWPRKSL